MSTHDPLLRDAHPADLLAQWGAFVEGCEEGYEYNLMEYHADLSVRDRIEAYLREPGGADAEFAARVGEVDARFRALLQPGVQVGPEGDPWWHRGVPRYAGDSLADGVREWFNVEVDVRD